MTSPHWTQRLTATFSASSQKSVQSSATMRPLQRGHRPVLLIRARCWAAVSIEFSLGTALTVTIDASFFYDSWLPHAIRDEVREQLAFQQNSCLVQVIDVAEIRRDWEISTGIVVSGKTKAASTICRSDGAVPNCRRY